MNGDGAEGIGVDDACPGVGDRDVELATVPVRGIHEPPKVDPVAHELDIETRHRRVDGKVENARPREATPPPRPSHNSTPPRPQLLTPPSTPNAPHPLARHNP